ncbi:hypothetical protein MKY29_09460 [Psychrobacillus sp. FSL K6-2365]|uniref:hypothetical protein n=1 Tax=Psychrobacillus sp. FSL K6-2365 TaxID=2921546 RepID=UPI0030FCB92A
MHKTFEGQKEYTDLSVNEKIQRIDAIFKSIIRRTIVNEQGGELLSLFTSKISENKMNNWS